MAEFNLQSNSRCGNCFESLPEGTSAKSIVSTWEKDNEERSSSRDVPIYEALAIVFEVGPLNEYDPSRKGKFFVEGDTGYGLCYTCSEVLGTLYNSFKDFTSVCKLPSVIGKILNSLEQESVNGGALSTRDKDSTVVKIEPVGSDVSDDDEEGIDTEFDARPDKIKVSPGSSPIHENSDVDYYNDAAEDPDSNNDENRDPLAHSSDDEKIPRRRSSRRAAKAKREYTEDVSSEDEDVSKKSSCKLNLLQCSKCPQQFLYETTLMCHLRIIHRQNVKSVSFPVPLPPKYYGSSKGETSTCPICRIEVSRSEIRAHLSIHTRSIQRPWLCSLCCKEFKNQKELYQHAESHKSTIPCQYCGKKIPRLEILSHFRICIINSRPRQQQVNRTIPTVLTVERERQGTWSCKLCDIKFSSWTDMSTHMATHKQAKRYTCKICLRKFDRIDMMRLHVKRFHRNNQGPPSVSRPPPTPVESHFDDNDIGSPPGQDSTEVEVSSQEQTKPIQRTLVNRFMCKGCDLDFPRYGLLEAHLLESHANTETSTCNICSRKLEDNFCLALHQKSHTDTRPFSCHVCEKTYRDKSAFYYHLREAHNLDTKVVLDTYPEVFKLSTEYRRRRVLKGEMLFKPPPKRGEHACDSCDKVFPFLHSLKYHQKHVHEKVKDFICSYCGKTFARKAYFVIHERLHTSTETPYKCHLCGKGFRLPGNLRAHLQSTIHNSEKNFICDVCGKGFNRRDNLRLHVRGVHQKLGKRNPKDPSRYTTGGRRRIYGDHLPSDPSSSTSDLPSTSAAVSSASSISGIGQFIDASSGSDSFVSHPNFPPQQINNFNTEQSSAQHTGISTPQYAQLNFSFPYK